MNKKHFLIASLGFVVLSGSSAFAQKAKIKEANKELDKALIQIQLGKKDVAAEAYKKALEAAEAATQDPTTATQAASWFAKAAALTGMMQVESLQETSPYVEGTKAFIKAYELDKKFVENQSGVEGLVINNGFYFYNDGIHNFNSQKNQEAYDDFENSKYFLAGNFAKKFVGNKQIDTIVAQVNLNQGYAAHYLGKQDEAISLLTQSIKNPITGKNADAYRILAEAYGKKGDKKGQLDALVAARKELPNDKGLAAAELNYYLESGDKEATIKKFEDAAAADPTNAQYVYNLGILYDNLGAGKDAKALEYQTKSEESYKKAMELDPKNPAFAFNYGASMYNKAKEYYDKINDLGMSSADKIKEKEYSTKMNSFFTKAIAPLEAAKKSFQGNKAKTEDDMKSYIGTLDALKTIYTIQNNEPKLDEINAILKDLY